MMSNWREVLQYMKVYMCKMQRGASKVIAMSPGAKKIFAPQEVVLKLRHHVAGPRAVASLLLLFW